MSELIAGKTFETIFSYHADTVALGAMVQRAGVPHLVLTHLIPGPKHPRMRWHLRSMFVKGVTPVW
jgi:ribonuclease Z